MNTTPRLSVANLLFQIAARAVVAVVLVLLPTGRAEAQLEITEVLFNPLSANDNAWEFIEVRNLSGSPVDLDGAFAGRVGDEAAAFPAVDGTLAANTVVPAGGIAVLYDANLGTGNPSNFNDQQFRDAWGLGDSVPLIGVNSFPPLTNGGTAFGFWADSTAYNNDVSDIGSGPEVTSLANTLFSLDYTTGTGFPAGTNGTSMRWGGVGDYQVGGGWALSALGETGVTTSTVVNVAGFTNSTLDRGSPGVVPGDTAAAGLLISEIMYNPDSPADNSWEWVEIYNNTGSTIDFSATNYVLDDNDNPAHAGANITGGSVADGAVAVLYNGDDLSQQNMIDAWDPGGADGTNFIAVSGSNWTGGFANSSDTVALWDDFATGYLGEVVTGSWRTTANAVSVVDYDDDGTNWPFDDGEGSIYLVDLSLDQNTGGNWILSNGADSISFLATGLPGIIEIHPGGDIGSPGTFDSGATDPADLNMDGFVDGLDLGILLGSWNQTTTPELGELNGIPPVDGLDLGLFLGAWNPPPLAEASAVPEPTSAVLCGLAIGLASVPRRRRGC